MNSKPIKGQAILFDHNAYFQSVKALFTHELRNPRHVEYYDLRRIRLSEWLLTDLLNNE